MNNTKKLLLITFVTNILILFHALPSFSLASDIKGHWAEKQIRAWQVKGLITGYPDGTFRPNRQITRAELITLINRAFGYSNNPVNFSDIPHSAWHANQIAQAKTVGYIAGYPDGTIKPDAMVSRQEFAAMLYKILKLSASPDVLNKFIDTGRIQSWSKISINAIVENGYMAGYPDSTLRPEQSISRGEAVALLDRVVGTLADTAGTFGGAQDITVIKGNVTISIRDVILRNTVIEGNLYLTEGIGDGEVTLDNVTVKGNVIISGGGINSIIINDSILGPSVVSVPDSSKVRLVTTGITGIAKLTVHTPAILEEDGLTGPGFSEVIINAPDGTDIELKGDFDIIRMDSPVSKLSLLAGTVKELLLGAGAKGSTIILAAGSTVKNLVLNTPADVTGQGKIEKAAVTSNGTTFEKKPDTITFSPGVTSLVSGVIHGSSNGNGGSGAGSGGGNAADTSAPVNAAGYPLAGTVTGVTAEVLVKANEAGKAYYVVLDDGAAAPGAAQVKAGTDASDLILAANRRGFVNLAANTEMVISVNDLMASTGYDIYIVCEDTIPNLQAGPAKIPIATTTPISDLAVISTINNSAGFTFSTPTGSSLVKIQQSANSGPWMDSSLDSPLDAASSSALVNSLLPNTTYIFKLIVTGGPYSGESNTVTLTTEGDIQDFTSTSYADTTAIFGFSPPTGATGVKVQQSINGIAWVDSTLEAPLDAASTSATVTGLTPETEYYFRLNVTGGSFAGNSNQSVLITFETPLVTEARTDNSGNKISLVFNKEMQDPAGSHGDFTVDVNGAPVTLTSAALNITGTIIELFLDTPILNGNTVNLSYTPGTVTDADGVILASFTDIPVTNNVPVPVPVSDLSLGTDNRDVYAEFFFSAPTGASSIRIQQSADGGPWVDATHDPLSEISSYAQISGLTPNTPYSFKLVVVGGPYHGESNTVSYITEGNLQNFALTNITDTTADFSFSSPTGATAVLIRQSTGGAWTDSAHAPLDASSTSAVITGLNPGTNYTFILVATDGDFAGRSNQVMGSTLP